MSNGELVQVPVDLTGEEALRQGLVPVPPEMVSALMAMTEEQRLAWAAEQLVRTAKPSGVELVQPVGPLMKRGLERRKAKNEARRRRQGRVRDEARAQVAAEPEVQKPGWVILAR